MPRHLYKPALEGRRTPLAAPHNRAARSARHPTPAEGRSGSADDLKDLAVAVCCSSASVSSLFRAPSSLNSRTFSIAMTAWSAKVCSQGDLLVREGPHLARRTLIAPIGVPSRSIGAARTVRGGTPPPRVRATVSGNPPRRVPGQTSVWIAGRGAPRAQPPGRGRRQDSADRRPAGGSHGLPPPRSDRRRGERSTAADRPAQPHRALGHDACTGWRSVGELEITRRISAVAVCCSSASVSSRFLASSSWNSRTFSIAITA